MGLSNFEWTVVHADGETETVETDSIYNVVDEKCRNDEQPIAIIRGELKW